MNKKVKKYLKNSIIMVLTVVTMLFMSVNVFAGINNSKLVTGTQDLIKDVTTWLLVLAPVVTILLVIYFCIRRSAADEMDQKKWNNRIITAIVSGVGAVMASALINVITGYFA